MNVDIAEIIRLSLDQGHPVYIEGVGTLRRVNISAKFGEKRESILPPAVDIAFDDSTHPNKRLISMISDHYKLSKKKAGKYYTEFSKRVLNGLINYSKVNLVGLGLFEKDSENKVVFTADPAFTSQYYEGLPEIPIKFIPRLKKENVMPVAPEVEEDIAVDSSTDIISESENKEADAFENLLNKIQEDKQQEKSIDESHAEKHISSKEKENESQALATPVLERDFVELDMQACEKQKKSESSRNYTVPVLIALGILLLAFTTYKACQWIADSSRDPVMTSVEKSQNLGEEKEEALAQLAQNVSEETEMVMPDECVIITGTFATQNNIDKMVSKLEANGYVPYLEQFGPYTRTGIKFACNDLDLASYIRNVRTSIEPKAWYLDPALDVPYEVN